jgi:hypothetical protein
LTRRSLWRRRVQILSPRPSNPKNIRKIFRDSRIASPAEFAKRATLNAGRLDQVWRCRVNPDLVDAFAKKRLIEFVYEFWRSRIVEPHDYGIRGGVESLLGFQISGGSRSGTPHSFRAGDLIT